MSELTDRDYVGPKGLRVRGTVLVVPGRGETPHSYVRFAARLAADAYRVRVLDAPALDGSLDGLTAQITEAITAIEAAGPLVAPLVLVGSDSGAATVAALVARNEPTAAWWPRAVALAALPAYGTPDGGAQGWEEELDARTACPAHRAVLSDDEQVQRGTLATPVPAELLDAAYGSTADLPHLLLTGELDSYGDHEALARLAKGLPRARLAVVRGAHHDVLNDLQHRSVAAEVVSFLEALRDESALAPIVRVESSAW
ncbi:alpha/beta hydrolase [Jatrophihabitans sp.]|uniref:alpha/beta hydrolase n=1 Tax=Jatrophihabitans sp. TaxID=1932789 RepID=UPI0030C6F530|nr:hypothetical protein [Jatrophihabitans sp.]